VRYGSERILAAAKQGFTHAIVPEGNVPRKIPDGIRVSGVRRVIEALGAAF
jgi:DNA repair protein RadA/Sms